MADSLLRFGAFELDQATGELRRSGVLLRIQPQPLRVLEALASRAGEVVSREDLRRAVWGDGTFVDFEHGLNYCVTQVRRVLGDSAGSPRFVETVPRQGYRFVAPVTRVERTERAEPIPAAVPAAPPRARVARPVRRPWSWAGWRLVLLMGIGLTLREEEGAPSPRRGRTPAPPRARPT